MAKREPTEKQKSNRFKPGQSGNPKGRPRLHDSIAEAIRASDKGRMAKTLDAIWNKAARGDLFAAEWLVSHGWGKPPVEVGGEEGGPIEILVRHVRGAAS